MEIIFGLDIPFRMMKQELEKIFSLPIGDDWKEWILSKNLKRLIQGNRVKEVQRYSTHLFSDDLDQDSLSSSSVKLSVKNLLPGAEVEFSAGDRYHDLSSHDLPLEVGVGIIFTHIMPVLRNRVMGSELLQPCVKIVMKTSLIIVDKN
jgi:hypothetical protein